MQTLTLLFTFLLFAVNIRSEGAFRFCLFFDHSEFRPFSYANCVRLTRLHFDLFITSSPNRDIHQLNIYADIFIFSFDYYSDSSSSGIPRR